MTGATHLAAGLSIGIGLSILMDASAGTSATITLCTCIGSLLPDIDTSKSRLGHKIAPLSWILRIFVGHREIFHSLIWMFPLVFLAYLFPSALTVIVSAALGILSHLLLDSITASGVPLFWPFKYRLSLAKFRCGGIIDRTLMVCLYFFACTLSVVYIKQFLS